MDAFWGILINSELNNFPGFLFSDPSTWITQVQNGLARKSYYKHDKPF